MNYNNSENNRNMIFNKHHPITKEIRRNANIIGLGITSVNLISIAVILAIYFLTRTFFSQSLTGSAYNLLENLSSLIAYAIAFIVPTIFMVLLIRIPSEIAFPMRAPKLSLLIPGIFFCLGMSIVGVSLSEFVRVFLQSAFNLNPIMPDMTAPGDLPSIIIYVVNIVIFPAFLEEMMFRGVIMQSLRRFGDSFALITSAILFAFVHGNLVQGPNAFVMGLVIGYFVIRTGSLWTGVIIHFINNGVAVAMDFVIRSSSPSTITLIGLIMYVIYIGGGILSLIFLLAKNENMFRLNPSSLPMFERQKYIRFFRSIMIIVVIIITIIITAGFLERV